MRFCMLARSQRLCLQSLLSVVNSERQKDRPQSLEAESHIRFRANHRQPVVDPILVQNGAEEESPANR